ncbi:hypothetical protein KAI92_05305 [Candidatus Parcubacteria bacterium]|nr:hypothetical protein [Candidatus Parcubacteria bacterium]
MRAKIFFAVIIALFVVTAGAFAQDVQKGDSAKVLSREWVDIKNPDPIKNRNVTFKYDDSCNIQCGGIVTVVGIHGDLLLVRYTIDDKQSSGTLCPSDVVFFVAKEKFLTMTDKYNRRVQDEKTSEKNLIKNILKQ